jgi:hypothetical protein
MSLIVLLNLFVITIDITAAFVTEAIQREVFVEVRDIDGKIRLAKLLKYLYGLDDSPKAFHDGLVKHLLAYGYSQSIYDPCLFYKLISPTKYIIIVAYVDDFIVAASDYSLIELLHKELAAKYEVNIAPYIDYIGVRITPQPDGSTAFSRPFQLNKLFEAWRPVAPTRPALTPCTADYVKKRPTDAPRCDQKAYMSLLGSLTQLVDVRPDLSFAVSFCAQHTHHCVDADFQALLRIVDYLHHTKHHQLILRPGDTSMGRIFVQARGFCDAAFGLHPDGYSQLANALDLVPCDVNGVSISPEHETRPTGKINVTSTKSTTVDLSSADSEVSGMLKSVKDSRRPWRTRISPILSNTVV